MAEQFLSIAEVKSWADTIFAAIERAGISSVPLNEQSYHVFLSSEEPFDFTKPPGLGVADLDDDILDLRGEVKNYAANEGMVLWHALGHLQGIIGFLAHASGDAVAFLENGEEA